MSKRFLLGLATAGLGLGLWVSTTSMTTSANFNTTVAGSRSCSNGCKRTVVPFFRTMCLTCSSHFSSFGGCRTTCTPSGGGGNE